MADSSHRFLLLIGLAGAACLVALLFLWNDTGDRGEGEKVDARETQTTDRGQHSAAAAESDLQTTEQPPGRDEVAGVADPEKQEKEPDPEESGTRITGRVVDESGIPLADVTLKVYVRKVISRAVSAPDGTFEIPVLLPENMDSRTVSIVAASGFREADHFVKVHRGRTEEIDDLVLAPAGALSGIVIGEDGSPIPGANLAVAREDPGDLVEEKWRKAWPPEICESDLQWMLGDDGTFDLIGIPTGPVWIWAGLDHRPWNWVGPITIHDGVEERGIEIVLESVAAANRIEGVVQGPDGAAFPDANVRASRDGSSSRCVQTDAEGRFTLIWEHEGPLTIEVRDREKKYRAVRRDGIMPGTTGLIFRFEEPIPELRILVRTADDKPLQDFCITIIPNKQVEFERQLPPDFPHAFRRQGTTFRQTDLDEDGMARLAAIDEPFVLRAEAPQYDRASAGPFSPDSFPDPVEIVLQPVPGVCGVVTAAGKPVVGAKVTVHKEIPAGGIYRADNFLSRSRRESEADAATDAKGRFSLSLRSSGRFYVRAEADDFASSDIGPLAIDHRTGMKGIEIALTRGGVIEGRVVITPDKDPRGLIVGVSRGDGRPLKKKVDADGFFRFERLAPGPWQVAWIKDGSLTGRRSSFESGRDPAEPIEWTCVVEEGKTTRSDLDLTGEEEKEPAPLRRKRGRPPEGS